MNQLLKVFLFEIIFVHHVSCFLMNKNMLNKKISTFTIFTTNENNDLYADDSYGLLDLGRSIESSSSLQSEYSIDQTNDNNGLAIKQKSDTTKVKLEDRLDPEYKVDLDGDQSWLVVVRDSIEQRLGRPIWTNKSSQILQLEYRRSQALRAMALPDYVKHLILSVYIERTISMRDYNKEFKYEVKEFRKWLSEQKQKMGKSKVKKSPFMMAKLDVSKRWLRQSTYTDSSATRPTVVYDELTSPTPGFTVGSNSKWTTLPDNTFFTTAPQGVLTSSVLNWDKTAAEMPSLLAVAKDSSTDKSDVRSIFEIDGQEMYIPSQGVDSEYFVVL